MEFPILIDFPSPRNPFKSSSRPKATCKVAVPKDHLITPFPTQFNDASTAPSSNPPVPSPSSNSIRGTELVPPPKDLNGVEKRGLHGEIKKDARGLAPLPGVDGTAARNGSGIQLPLGGSRGDDVGARNAQPRIAVEEEAMRSVNPTRSQDGATQHQTGGIMDAEALISGIEDCGAAWGANFWVVLADPLTQCTFYACPSTGDCSWDPPIGAMVLPRKPEGEWWEISDPKRSGRSYYYHTRSGKTQWTRPTNALVIPLGLIQMNALDKRSRASSTSARLNGSVSRADGSAKRAELPGISVEKVSDTSIEPPSTPRQVSRSVSYQTIEPGTPTLKSKWHQSYNPSNLEGTAQDNGITEENRRHRRKSERRDGRGHEDPKDMLATLPTTPKRQSLTREQARRSLTMLPTVSPSVSPSAFRFERSTITINARGRAQKHHDHLVSNNSGSRSNGKVLSSPSLPSLPLRGRGPSIPSSPSTPIIPPRARTHRPRDLSTIAASSTAPSISDGYDGSQLYSPTSSRYESDGSRSMFGKQPFWRRKRSDPEEESTRFELANALSPRPQIKRARARTSDAPMTMATRQDRQPNGNTEALPMPPNVFGVRKAASDIDMRAKIQMILPNATGPIRVEGPSGQSPPSTNSGFLASSPLDCLAPKRKGLLRRKVAPPEAGRWQKFSISKPILSHTQVDPKLCAKAFKIIQHCMGDREAPVDGVPSIPTSSGGIALAAQTEANPLIGKDQAWNKAEQMLMLDEQRWLLQTAINQPDLRDELYAIAMKQSTDNPGPSSRYRGFQLLSVLCNTFPPSKLYEPFVKNFFEIAQSQDQGDVRAMASHCLERLEIIKARGCRARAPMYGELEHASMAAFYPSVFGQPLDRIMRSQQSTYPDRKVPLVLPFLAEGIVALGGLNQEGMFRIPGDADSVAELKSRLDRGHLNLDGVQDPHIVASLFKLWLRELRDPVVADDRYNDALEASQNPMRCCEFVKRMARVERRVLIFVISFIQMFLKANVSGQTKMTAVSLSLVFAPNILRTTATTSEVVYTNSAFESRFILNLLHYMRAEDVDPGYVPELPNPIRDSRPGSIISLADPSPVR